jgi:hypothetical protein
MLLKEKKGNIARNNQRLNIKLAIIYFLLVLLFISLIVFL